MNAADGEETIVFNGEIYNFMDLRADLERLGHSFRSNSDTEVVLAAYKQWGVECVHRFNGMFAFALYDGRQRRLFLARDRAGEKPLFYAPENGTIRFSSELKGLLASPSLAPTLDPVALDCFLSEGYVPHDLCILQGVKKLPPAHALTFDVVSGTSHTWRYWQLPPPAAASGPETEFELLSELERLLEDAVRRQLVGDVPIGILLSGGIDSSLVTAMAARTRGNIRTFTVRFPGHGRYDETEHARLIAKHFGTQHTELTAEESTVDLLPVLARQFDEPLIDSSMIPTHLLSRTVRQHCTVALGGDGGDELFGGYSHYSPLLWLQRRLRYVPLPLRRLISCTCMRMLPIGSKGRNWLSAVATDFSTEVPLIANYFDRESRRELVGNRSHAAGIADRLREQRTPRTGDLIERATRMDFENYLAHDILVKVDRASMLTSLEVRAPMLDYRIIEFAFGRVPSKLKATHSSRKVLLKRLAGRVLPAAFDQSRKQGFSIPLTSWLSDGPWLEYFRDVLLDRGQTLFDHRYVDSLFRGQRRGRNNGERLFGLVMFELWRREYRVAV